ncbi:tyrosine-type recombinase/integrase [Pseudomonas sp. GB2N2]
MSRQLYSEYQNCLLPRTGRSGSQTKPWFALLAWPNGKPCTLVNYWLTDLATRTTGKTVKQYCVGMTPFVRYCYDKEISLVDFNDEHMNDLSFTLAAEKLENGSRKKQNDYVNSILSNIIEFLTWIQFHGNPTNHSNLVGFKAGSPNICVIEKKNKYGKTYLHHESFLEARAPLHKKDAMPREFIQSIEDQTFLESDPELYPSIYKHRYNNSNKKTLIQQTYLYQRRIMIMWAFKRAGLRPSELIEMPLDDNLNVVNSLILYLPTKKLRTDSVVLRPFKTTNDGALTVKYYLDARENFIAEYGEATNKPISSTSFFLTETGRPLSADSMAKDFGRVAKRAGLTDVRVCFSMFRHRFITLEILSHFKELFGSNRPTTEMLTVPVVKNIENRIRKKTGHKLGDSIWHYFDEAFEAIDFWKSVDRALANMEQIGDAEDNLQRLKYDQRKAYGNEALLSKELTDIEKGMAAIRAKMNIFD